MKTKSSWMGFVLSLLGIWLISAPKTFNFSEELLIWNDWILGTLLFFLGLWCRKTKTRLLPWVIGILGIWIQAAPLLFKTPDPQCYLNDTLVGALVVAFSLLMPKFEHEKEEEPSIPPGWTYNPSSWPQRLPIAFLVFICWMLSRYLAAFELGYIEEPWDPFFKNGTLDVLTSTISKDFPIPDAGIGAFAYTLEFLSTLQGGKARWRTEPWLVLVFGFLVIPVGFTSVCLVILQPVVVETFCTLCLVTAVCMLFAIPFAIDEVMAAFHFLKSSKGKSFKSVLFNGGECQGAQKEKENLELDQSLTKLFKIALKGVSFPLNLICSFFLGTALIVVPWAFGLRGFEEDLALAMGALIAVFSVLCFSEWARPLRWFLLFFAMVTLVATLSSLSQLPLFIILFQIILSISLGICAFFRGKTKNLPE